MPPPGSSRSIPSRRRSSSGLPPGRPTRAERSPGRGVGGSPLPASAATASSGVAAATPGVTAAGISAATASAVASATAALLRGLSALGVVIARLPRGCVAVQTLDGLAATGSRVGPCCRRSPAGLPTPTRRCRYSWTSLRWTGRACRRCRPGRRKRRPTPIFRQTRLGRWNSVPQRPCRRRTLHRADRPAGVGIRCRACPLVAAAHYTLAPTLVAVRGVVGASPSARAGVVKSAAGGGAIRAIRLLTPRVAPVEGL